MNKIFALSTLLTAATALAGPATVKTTLTESAFNRIANALPAPSGNIGAYSLTVAVPCPTAPWKWCNQTLFSSTLSWKINSARYVITPQGIALTGTLRMSFAGYTVDTPISSNVSIGSSVDEIIFSTSSVTTAVTFNLPGYGAWTPTFTIPLGSTSFRVGIRPMRIDVPRPDGSKRTLSTRATSLNVVPQWGALVVNTEQTSW